LWAYQTISKTESCIRFMKYSRISLGEWSSSTSCEKVLASSGRGRGAREMHLEFDELGEVGDELGPAEVPELVSGENEARGDGEGGEGLEDHLGILQMGGHGGIVGGSALRLVTKVLRFFIRL
jgi:hypothetical protein